MMENYEAIMSLAEHATIYGHNIWHYLIDTSIGEIHVVEFETKDMSLERKIFDGNKQKAENYFKKTAKELLDGKYL